MAFDMQKVRAKIQMIEENIRRLEALQARAHDEFIGDFLALEAAKHLLQVSVEAMLDIGAHLTARLRLKTPRDGAQVFQRLAQEGLLPAEHVPTYTRMVKFRNLLVHLYQEVDAEQVYQIVQKELGDFRMFISDVWAIVHRQPGVSQ
jgi:uncharacterized protein YutE (UPF0331/DUF86 family)